VSDLQNPPLLPSVPDGGVPPEIQLLPPPLAPVPDENPSWGVLEIIGILLVAFVALIFLIILVVGLGHHFLYPRESFIQVAQQHPYLAIAAQGLDYLVVAGFMAFLVKRTSHLSFAGGIRWNWPANPWTYLMAGVALCVAILFVQRILPMPKDVPMDRLFRTPAEAWAMSVFGTLLAPLIEELFFRGFLYPVLARKLGMIVSIGLTGALFGLVHASQLGLAWGPVLLIFLVGLTLTTVRALTKSVAAGWLVHFAYNGTIFFALIMGTSGFRHLEKLPQ
jgi:membrane protease YdiL (CAAX protease family)